MFKKLFILALILPSLTLLPANYIDTKANPKSEKTINQELISEIKKFNETKNNKDKLKLSATPSGTPVELTASDIANSKYFCYDVSDFGYSESHVCYLHFPKEAPGMYYAYSTLNTIGVKFTGAIAESTNCFMDYNTYIPDDSLSPNALRCINVPGSGNNGVPATGEYDVTARFGSNSYSITGVFTFKSQVIKNFNNWTPSSATVFREIEQESDPALNKLYQSIVGTDTKLYTRSTTDGTNWTPWTDGLSAVTMLSEPKMEYFNGVLYQIVYGTDTRTYTRTYNETSNTWSNWREGNGINIASKPESAVYNGRLWISVRGIDNRLYTRVVQSDHTTFGGWVEGGGITIKGSPKMVSATDGLYQIAWGTDNGLYYRKFTSTNPTTATAWARIGSITLGSSPAVVNNNINGFDDLTIYATGTDNVLYRIYGINTDYYAYRVFPTGDYSARLTPSVTPVFEFENAISATTISGRLYQTLDSLAYTNMSSGITVISSSQEDMFKGRLYQVVAGSDRRVWTRSRN